MVRRTQKNYSVYASLVLMNIGLIVMFSVVLQPRPHETIVATGVPYGASVSMPRQPDQLAKQGVPQKVVVPDIGIRLAVKPGSYEPERQRWTLDHSSAFFADRTVPANDSNGTTFLYAHAEDHLFGKLPQLRPGSRAEVYTDTGLVFRYVFESSRQVSPRDTSALTSAGPPMLVLQTCSGPFDAYRTLVAFHLVEVVPYE